METFTVTNESIVEFFKDYAIGFKEEGSSGSCRSRNPCHELLRDHIFIKQSNIRASKFEFIIKDRGMYTDRPLILKYTYEPIIHDSVCLKLNLLDISVAIYN